MASQSVEESLERAVRHVSIGWLPPQEEVLQKIQAKFESGEYDRDKLALTEDLKEDFALYMYCLRELSAQLEKVRAGEFGNPDQFKDGLKMTPNELFDAASVEEFKAILNRPRKEISNHSIEEMNEFQALRFRESMLSAATAEALSEKVSVDPEVGFSCGLLRQLGMTLIAWNYPRVYRRAVETLSEGTNLDLSLKRVLGFTPTLLGVNFARKWNLSEDILSAMSGRQKTNGSSGAFRAVSSSQRNRAVSTADTLAKICEVGEALARANDPEHYPSALSDWEAAEEAITEYLGPEGVNDIYQRAQNRLSNYAKTAPSVQCFTDCDEIKEKIVGSHYSSRLIEKHQHLRSAPEEVKAEIKKLYAKFKPNKILKSNIDYLIKEIVPQAGFESGAIFMFDPERNILSPAVKVGEPDAKKLRSIKVGSHLAQFNLVASAYGLKSPLREQSTNEQGERTTLFAAALGTITPVGVLYLEYTPQESDDPDADSMVLFRILRQCLCDCLNVS